MGRRREVESGYEKVLVGKRASKGPDGLPYSCGYHHSTSCLVSTCGTAVLSSSPVENLCDHQPTAICYPR